MFDHPPGRQFGQFVIIGRPEQLILEGLLLADVGRTRKQQVAVRDTYRAMAGQQDLFDRARDEAFFRNGSVPGAEQLDTVLTAVIQLHGRSRRHNSKLGRRRIVHQQKAALLVLNGHAGGEHSEHILQNAELALSNEFVLDRQCGALHVILGAVWHLRRTCQGLL